MEKAKQNYRQKIYEKYVSVQSKPGIGEYSVKDYHVWAGSAQKRFQGWLPVEKNTPILDMGCGAGNFLFTLYRLGYTNLTGVDLSPEQVQLAYQWCPNATIIQGDIRPFLEQNPSHFSLVCGLDLIEHFPKDEILPFLELIYQALRPGGRLILQTPNAASPWVGSVSYSDFTHEWFFSPAGLERILAMAGFTAFQARESRPYVHGIKSMARFMLWQLIRNGLRLYDLIETGGNTGEIYTRVFVATVLKDSEY